MSESIVLTKAFVIEKAREAYLAGRLIAQNGGHKCFYRDEHGRPAAHLNHWLRAPSPPPQRFTSQGGTLHEWIAGRPHPLTLTEAARLVGEWSREAVTHDQRGDHALARVFGRDALALSLAASAAEGWARCAAANDMTGRAER